MDERPADLGERRNLLRGAAWDALVALVVAEAEYASAVESERCVDAAA